MSAYLSKMVGKAEAEVAQFIEQMEDKFCYPSIDIRLLDEINRVAAQKMVELGLDPKDTAGEELYHALRVKFDRDAQQIDRAVGISADMDLPQRVGRAVQFVHRVHGKDEVWALMSQPARELLRMLPPKKTMARLNYRSLESLLKREEPGRILLCAQYLESAAWQKSLLQCASHLSAADYEQRPVHFVFLRNVPKDGPPNHVAVSKLSGSLAVWPDRSLENASGLHLILLLLGGLNELGIQAEPRTIADAHPVLNWWANASHLVSLHQDHPISFNLHDVATNHLRGNDYSVSAAHYGGKSLWAELEARYGALGGEIIPKVEAQIEQKARKITMPTAAQLAEDMVSV